MDYEIFFYKSITYILYISYRGIICPRCNVRSLTKLVITTVPLDLKTCTQTRQADHNLHTTLRGRGRGWRLGGEGSDGERGHDNDIRDQRR
jgi:DNA-directed RNA polymerase subunit RPC12/RpoP